MKKLNLLLFVMLGTCALGQVSSKTVVNRLGQPVAGATIAVCTSVPGTTVLGCPSILASTFTDATLSVACSAPAGTGLTSGVGCSNPGKSDGKGNYVIFSNFVGVLYAQLYGSGITPYVDPFSIGAIGTSIPGQKIVDGVLFLNIQTAVNAAGTTGSVLIPSTYAGVDSYTNPNHVPILDLRNQSFQANNIGSIRNANVFSGSDPGAKANAADIDLGAATGEIWLSGGGAISTQIVVSSNHTLKLSGTFTNALGLRIPVIRLSDNSTLVCAAKQACIVQESSNAGNSTPVIVCAFNLGSTCATLTPNTTNIHVSGIHFQGANPNVGTSLIDSVSLGNCTHCSVNDNWFDNIKSSHILIGGTSGSNFWSDGFEVSGNNFSGAGNCSVCVINGQNISIHDNFWSLHGNGAAADIDIEPNSTTDHAQGIDIHDNVFDESLALNTVFCVTMQNGQFVAMGRVKIHDNLCDGGPFTTFGNVGATGTFKLTQCFAAGPGSVNTMSDVEIYSNICRVTVQGGISLVGVNRGSIHDNVVQCNNDYAITLAGSVTNSVVERNRVMTVTSPNSCGQSPGGVYKSATIGETNANNSNNIFKDNLAAATFTNGTGSKVISSPLIDGTGQSFHVPVGLNAGASGGIQLVSLGAPVLIQKAGNFGGGSCVLTGTTYFYKMRAVGAAGGMGPPSNEVTFNNGGGFGCGGIKWGKIPGAASYNIYRSTTTGTELLIDSVTNGNTFYDDFGGQTPSTAIDSNDSSVEIAGAESKPPAGIPGSDIKWPDDTGHCWKMNNNNAGNSGCIPGIDIDQTWTGQQTFNSTVTNVVNLTASATVSGTSISTGGDSFSGTPRIVWGCFLPSTLNATWTACEFVNLKSINVVSVDWAAKTAPSGCGTFPVVRITDGSNNVDTTINTSAGHHAIGGGQNYAANATLLVKVSTAGIGCAPDATDVNISVQYKMQ